MISLADAAAPAVIPAIADGGAVPFVDLFEALSVVGLDALRDAGDDPWTAALGLRVHDLGTRSRWFNPVRPFRLADGMRHGCQVVLRRGDDESLFGLTAEPGHILHQLLIRAEFPAFELTGFDGVITASWPAPQAVHDLVADLEWSDAWSSLHVIAGSEGIVFVRPAEHDLLGGFVYDLWLGERLAALLAAPALERDPITRHVRLPYGAARAESLLSVACTASAH